MQASLFIKLTEVCTLSFIKIKDTSVSPKKWCIFKMMGAKYPLQIPSGAQLDQKNYNYEPHIKFMFQPRNQWPELCKSGHEIEIHTLRCQVYLFVKFIHYINVFINYSFQTQVVPVLSIMRI